MKTIYEVRDLKIEDHTYKVPMRNGRLFQNVLNEQLSSNYPLDIIVGRAENGIIHLFGNEKKQLHRRVYNSDTGRLEEETSFKRKEEFGEDFFLYGHGTAVGVVSFGLIGIVVMDLFGYEPSPDVVTNVTLPAIITGFVAPYVATIVHNLRPSVKGRRNKTIAYFNEVETAKKKNQDDLVEAVKDVRLYQGSIDEVAEDLKTSMERIDTGEPKTYICNDDPFKLRVEAAILGADAVVHYQRGSSMGTPVRFV